jgi:hypothetical protein
MAAMGTCTKARPSHILEKRVEIISATNCSGFDLDHLIPDCPKRSICLTLARLMDPDS